MKKADETQLARLVDALGRIEAELNTAQVAMWKAKEKAASELRKQITALAGGDPNVDLSVMGNTYEAVLGPRENERELAPMPKLFRKLGQATFLKACGFTLTAFDALSKQWPDKEKDALVTTARTGSRSVKTFRIEAAKAA